MISVAVVVSERCQASGVMATLDLLIGANYCHGHFMNKDYEVFETTLIGLDSQHKAYNGYLIGPLVPIETIQRPDVLIIPGIIEAVNTKRRIAEMLEKYEAWFEILREWQKQGTLIASSCSGSLLIAAADLAKGRDLTCHWIMKDTAASLYPNENFDTDKMLLDHGTLISSGGSGAINQMVLFIIERMKGRELAVFTAKMMLIDLEHKEQSSFALFQPNKRHGDTAVMNLQKWLEEHYKGSVLVGDLAEQCNMSERQLSRRFKKATGETPSTYIQRLRLEHVKHSLENSHSPANAIIWDAGYEDLSSFRRLFKRSTGMTMNKYRQRFGLGEVRG